VARNIDQLSVKGVANEKKPGRHADGGNLYLVVSPLPANADAKAKPSKRWLFMYKWGGKQKEMGLGSTNAVTLARARELAANCRAMLAENTDPIEARRAEAAKADAGHTFGEVAKQLHAAREDGWKNTKYTTQWMTSLEVYCAPIWSKRVEAVTVADILAILQPIWTTKAETAGRTRGRIEAVLDAARARGLIPEDRANPARWRGHLSHLLPKKQKLQRGHHAAMPFGELPGFIETLRQRPATAASCLEFAILTAARSGEAIGARWNEIDFAAKVWTVPGGIKGRMKSKKEHRVPLSDRCVVILRTLEPLKAAPDGFVFPGQKAGRPLSSMALEMLLRRMAVPVTPHGFRSSFRDWCGEATSFPREVAEAALAHPVGNSVELAYRRGDALEKRRQLMQAWADYCNGATLGNVVPLKRVAWE
jgi:integrase